MVIQWRKGTEEKTVPTVKGDTTDLLKVVRNITWTTYHLDMSLETVGGDQSVSLNKEGDTNFLYYPYEVHVVTTES